MDMIAKATGEIEDQNFSEIKKTSKQHHISSISQSVEEDATQEKSVELISDERPADEKKSSIDRQGSIHSCENEVKNLDKKGIT